MIHDRALFKIIYQPLKVVMRVAARPKMAVIPQGGLSFFFPFNFFFPYQIGKYFMWVRFMDTLKKDISTVTGEN